MGTSGEISRSLTASGPSSDAGAGEGAGALGGAGVPLDEDPSALACALKGTSPMLGSTVLSRYSAILVSIDSDYKF